MCRNKLLSRIIKQHDYRFLFKLKGNTNIGIKLLHGVYFFFSGYFLTQRQSTNFEITTDDTLFINFASYGNVRMYRYLKASIKRKL